MKMTLSLFLHRQMHPDRNKASIRENSHNCPVAGWESKCKNGDIVCQECDNLQLETHALCIFAEQRLGRHLNGNMLGHPGSFYVLCACSGMLFWIKIGYCCAHMCVLLHSVSWGTPVPTNWQHAPPKNWKNYISLHNWTVCHVSADIFLQVHLLCCCPPETTLF